MALDEIRHEREAQACEQAVDKVAEAGSQAGEERRPAATVEGALYHQHSYRPHRSRHKNAYQHASE